MFSRGGSGAPCPVSQNLRRIRKVAKHAVVGTYLVVSAEMHIRVLRATGDGTSGKSKPALPAMVQLLFRVRDESGPFIPGILNRRQVMKFSEEECHRRPVRVNLHQV